MLEWETMRIGAGSFFHTGKRNGVTYAYIAQPNLGNCVVYQFRGLEGADLDSDGAKTAVDLETAKKICDGMMSAWKHKAN